MCKLFKMAGCIFPSFLALVALTGAKCSNRNYVHQQDQIPTRGGFSNGGLSSDSVHYSGDVLSWSASVIKQNSSSQASETLNLAGQNQNQRNERPYLGQNYEQNNQLLISVSTEVMPTYNKENTFYTPAPTNNPALQFNGRNPSNGNVPGGSQQYDRTNGNVRPGGSSVQESSSGYRGQSSISHNPMSTQGVPVTFYTNGDVKQPGSQGPYPPVFKISGETSEPSQPNAGSIQGEIDYSKPNNKPVSSLPAVQPPPMDTFGYNNFAWNLFKNADNDYGVIVSPAILAYQLLLFKEYSQSQTQKELEMALRNIRREQIRQMVDDTRALPTTKLELANGIFYEGTVRINSHFKNADQGFTHVEPFYVSQAANAIASINKWTKNVTHGEIAELLDPSFQIERVKMILATAMYFKGTWKHRFNTTVDGGVFVNYRNEQKTVPFMEIRNNIIIDRMAYRVGPKTINVQVVQLPYDDETHAMLLLIPMDKQNRISDIREHFTGEKFSEIVDSISQNSAQRVTLKMPKFSMNSEISPVTALQNMGIRKLFTDGADLLIADPPQRVGDIIQRSVLRVDEIGTTAASVAASFLIPLSADSVVNREIIIDRPFLSIIYNTKNNAALFISHVTNV